MRQFLAEQMPYLTSKIQGPGHSSTGIGGGVTPYFDPHDIFNPEWNYRYKIFTPCTIFSPPHYK